MKLKFLSTAGQDSINKQILRVALIVGAFSILARAAAVIKELIVARSFGRSDALDAFLIAFLLPAFVVTIVSGTVGSALVPVFVQVQQRQGREAAEKLLSSMSLISAATLGAMAPL